MTLLLGVHQPITKNGRAGQQIYLSDEARLLGTYVIGTTGTGKSTFLQSMILQDIQAGKGVCVLDPHGDLIEDILPRIDDRRIKDVVLLDPNDLDYPFALNLFACNRTDPREREFVTSALLDTLYKLFYYSWGPRMEHLLRSAIQTLLFVPNSTLLELMLLLTDYDQRQTLIQPAIKVDPMLYHYWLYQFPEDYEEMRRAKGGNHEKTGRKITPKEQQEMLPSAINKVGRFLSNSIVRNIVCQPTSFNFRNAMDNQQIVLVNLSKGDIGADNSSFLGAIIANQILLAALTRRELPQAERSLFCLYVDEYQNFATETFPQLQSEARKFGIATTVAHQYRSQLDESNIGSTLNVANLIVFRVSGNDAFEMSGQFDNTPFSTPYRFEPILQDVGNNLYISPPEYDYPLYRRVEGHQEPYSDVRLETANSLARLPQFQAFVRIVEGRQLTQYRMDTLSLERMAFPRNPQKAIFIRDRARQFCTPRPAVETEIWQRMSTDTPDFLISDIPL